MIKILHYTLRNIAFSVRICFGVTKLVKCKTVVKLSKYLKLGSINNLKKFEGSRSSRFDIISFNFFYKNQG